MKRATVITALASAALAGNAGRAGAAATPVRIALLPVDAAATLYYANDQGAFRDAGIEPQIQVIQAGSAIVTAIVAGSLDIGWSNPISVAAAHLRGLPIVAIAAGGIYRLHEASAGIVVPKDSKIAGARDFAGKTMACSGLRTLGQWAPAAWIDKNGGDSRQLQFVEMPFPDMPLALAEGRVDSAFPAEPFITEARDVAHLFADAFAAIAPRFSIGVWVTTSAWADAHRDVVAKFAEVMGQTATWANAHHEQTAAILAKYGKLDPAVARRMVRVSYAPALQAADLQPIVDLAAHYSALPSPVPAEQLVYRA